MDTLQYQVDIFFPLSVDAITNLITILVIQLVPSFEYYTLYFVSTLIINISTSWKLNILGPRKRIMALCGVSQLIAENTSMNKVI